MFVASGARQVGRHELQSPASSPRSSPDPAVTELLRSLIQDECAFATTDDNVGEENYQRAVSENDEIELRLFAAPSNPAQSHKIRLSSPTATAGEPGFLVKKPRSYYLADEVTSENEDNLAKAAVTGEEVLNMSRVPWPGCALPWKVQTITAAGHKEAVLVGDPPSLVVVEERDQRRKRKGKKSRIALRKKLHAAKERDTERARLAQEKEETEREKRTRRNREKKVKKKAREKAKKAAEEETEESPPQSTETAD